MKYILYSILFLIPKITFCQKGSSINSPILIEIKALPNFKAPFNPTFIKFISDTISNKIEIKLSCTSWEIIDVKNNVTSFSFDSIGDIIPSENQIMAGYCYCSSCSKNQRTLAINKRKDIVFKMMNCSSNHQITEIVPKSISPQKWHERTWSKGEKINLENLLFYPNKSMFLNESYEELNELYLMLEKQKQIKISISGHVNGPNSKNTEEFQLLSENRAKAVYDYLIKRGIDTKRLNYKGFGNSQMLYPKPDTEEQMKYNRRVEILIL